MTYNYKEINYITMAQGSPNMRAILSLKSLKGDC